jgi:hypothetical protein
MSNIAIVTYPRSGANYLSNLLLNNCRQEINYFHIPENSDRFIISIARDPFESIHSHVAMRKHYHPSEDYSKRYNNEYIDMYNFLYENANIVIKYADLIEFPEKVLLKISDDLKFEINPLDIPVPVTVDNRENTYLRSSKTSPEYKKEHFKREDILDCYESYNKLLLKSIDLTKPLP